MCPIDEMSFLARGREYRGNRDITLFFNVEDRPNVEDTIFGVVSLGTSHYFSKMAALRPIS